MLMPVLNEVVDAPQRSSDPARARIGFLVNPIAGLGGRTGLKGTDEPDSVERALALGAVPQVGARASAALGQLCASWWAQPPGPLFFTVSGPMGAAAGGVGLEVETIEEAPITASTTTDVHRAAPAVYGSVWICWGLQAVMRPPGASTPPSRSWWSGSQPE
jgi:hypothetical protein